MVYFGAWFDQNRCIFSIFILIPLNIYSVLLYFFLFIQNLLFFPFNSWIDFNLVTIQIKNQRIVHIQQFKNQAQKNWPTIFTAVPLCPFPALTIFAVFSLRWAFTLNVPMIDFNTRDNFSFIFLTTQLGFFLLSLDFSKVCWKNIDIFIFLNNKNTLIFNYFEIGRVIKFEWINKNSRSKGS